MKNYQFICLAVALLLLGIFAGMHLQSLIAERDYYKSKTLYYEAMREMQEWRKLARPR